MTYTLELGLMRIEFGRKHYALRSIGNLNSSMNKALIMGHKKHRKHKKHKSRGYTCRVPGCGLKMRGRQGIGTHRAWHRRQVLPN